MSKKFRKMEQEMNEFERKFFAGFVTTIDGGVKVSPDGTPVDKSVFPRGTEVQIIPVEGVIVGWDFDYYLVKTNDGQTHRLHKSIVQRLT